MRKQIAIIALVSGTAFFAGCMKQGATKSEPVKKTITEEVKSESAGDTIAAVGLKWDKAVKDLDWNKADAYCKSNGKRLPTKDELIAGFKSKVMDLRNPKYGYWSSTQDNNDKGAAWLVSFEDGGAGNSVKSTSAYVRCVATK